MIEHLRESQLLKERTFRSSHPRNTGLITYMASIKRQGALGKPFLSRGSSRLIHNGLLELLLNPQPLMNVSPPQPQPQLPAQTPAMPPRWGHDGCLRAA